MSWGLISGLDAASFKGNLRALTVRSVLLTVGGGLTGGLNMLYVKSVLGADAVILGLFTSVWCSVFVILILFGGWISDRYNRKRVFLLGTALALPSPIIYALAPSWHAILIVNVIQAVSAALVSPAYTAILFSSVEQSKRSRTIATINTLSHLANIAVPPLAASAIQWMGGLNCIRVMFLLQFVVSSGVWFYTSRAIQVQADKVQELKGLRVTVKDLFGQMRRVYRLLRERKATTWLYLYLTAPLTHEVVGPFWTIYAAEVCGAPLYVIGLLSTVSSLTMIFLQIPLAKVSDMQGRKKIILAVRPFRYVGLLVLILAGTLNMLPFTPFIPLLAWILIAIVSSGGPSWEAASTEVMPEELQGTWNSLRNFLYHLVAIPCGLIGGLLWNIDPRLPFIMALTVGCLIRYPILFRRIPETVLARHRQPRIIGPHTTIYGLLGAGQTYTARLLQRTTGADIVDEMSEKADEKTAERRVRKILARNEETIVEGKPAVFAASQPERSTVVLLVASKEERIMRKVKELKKPGFVVLNLVEEEDRELQKLIKKLYKVDIFKLPPFDVAINTERIPPETVIKIISLIHEKQNKANHI